MDYIREELLRQRAVLARLLLGQAEMNTEKEQRTTALETGTEALRWALSSGDGRARGPAFVEDDPADLTRQALSRKGRSLPAIRRQSITVENTWPELAGAGAEPLWRRAAVSGSSTELEQGTAEESGGLYHAYRLPEESGENAVRRYSVREQVEDGGPSLPPEAVDGEGAGARPLQTAGVMERLYRRLQPEGDQTAREQVVTEMLWMGSGEANDPKAFSLAYQRDARRYDGGFRLY